MKRPFSRIPSLRRIAHPLALNALILGLDNVSRSCTGSARKQLRILRRCSTITLTGEDAQQAIKALTFAAWTSLRAACRLLPADYHSAAALARKALELTYALVVVARKGAEGIELLKQWIRRHHAAGLQEMMPALRHVEAEVDRGLIAGEIRNLREKIPNGETSLIEVAQLASWAELDSDHKMIYGSLNRYVHFDLPLAFQQYGEETEQNEYIAAWAVAAQAEISLVLQKTALYTLIARRDLGQSNIVDVVERNAKLYQEQSAALERLLQDLGKIGAGIAGWLPSESE